MSYFDSLFDNPSSAFNEEAQDEGGSYFQDDPLEDEGGVDEEQEIDALLVELGLEETMNDVDTTDELPSSVYQT